LSEKFEFFQKRGFNGFLPRISTVFEPISTKFSHNVQMSMKSLKIRESSNLEVKGEFHPPNFWVGVRKNAFLEKKLGGGRSPSPPNFFLFRR